MSKSLPNRILFLPSWYPNKTEPASGNFIQRQVEAVAPFDNIAVVFAAPVTELETAYEVVSKRDLGFPEVVVYYRKVKKGAFLLPVKKILRRYTAYKKGLKHLQKEWGAPELIHVQVAFPAILYAWWLKLCKRIPYILTEHGLTYYTELKKSIIDRYVFFVVKRAIKKARKVITVSNYLAGQMHTKGVNGTFTVIPNVVPLPDLLPDIKAPNNIKRILHISTLAEVKNIKGILRAIKQVKDLRNDFELVILSTHEERIDTATYCKTLGLDENTVKFKDYIFNTAELTELFLSCNFTLLFSNYETFSIVLAESLWVGRPVITSKCGGPQEFINEQFGLLVEPGDEKSLEEAITKMLDTWNLYDEKKLQEFAHSNFAPKIIGNKLHLIHSEICHPATPVE